MNLEYCDQTWYDAHHVAYSTPGYKSRPNVSSGVARSMEKAVSREHAR
jgi:hypothetical protein